MVAVHTVLCYLMPPVPFLLPWGLVEPFGQKFFHPWELIWVNFLSNVISA